MAEIFVREFRVCALATHLDVPGAQNVWSRQQFGENSSPASDVNNHTRQDGLTLEQAWRAHNWSRRIIASCQMFTTSDKRTYSPVWMYCWHDAVCFQTKWSLPAARGPASSKTHLSVRLSFRKLLLAGLEPGRLMNKYQ
ncbi:hypothetical protein EVAR_79536_1 [Eumeta japonica]|uniref:Uncharacterized protein n=1 Tax=Eumeta variegata TaxID=151549 RepID=A0A4C1Y8L8_EUMVA|nr:hypothetical protein EVAR_79536_1 [Eumeta japonica]